MSRLAVRGLGLVFTLVAIAATPIGGPPRLALAASPCDGWVTRTLFTGLGSLEYLLPDGTGGMLISNSSSNAIERITREGNKTTLVANVVGPGAMVRRHGQLYFATGDSAASGINGTPDGTIQRLDMTTHREITYSSGLVMPNGLTFSTAGDAYVTRDLGRDAQVVKVAKASPMQPQQHWANLGDTNGVRVDPTQNWLYVSTTFNQPANVYRIRLADPSDIELVASLASTGNRLPKGLDDMTEDARGILYIASNGSGEVFRLDPITGQSCQLASGLQNPSAVEFGAGSGWPRDHLFVCGFDGTIRELIPPRHTT